MIKEDAPTMSAGTGGFSGSAAATGPVAGFDPILGGTKKIKKRKYKRKEPESARKPYHPPKHENPRAVAEGREERTGRDSYLPFLISYDDAESYVLYGRSVAEIKIQLRKIYRPENHKKIKVKRLYPNEVIQWYWKKRQQALTNQ